MKIQVGEVYMDKVKQQKTLYPNKTRKYLLPCLREYGETFVNKLNNVFKVAVGIGDMILEERELKYERHIFILIDSSVATNFFNTFLKWVRQQEMYEDDYVYGNIQKSTYHMVVIKFPEKYYDSFKTFKEGKYSEMFDKHTIDNFFNLHPDIQKVFIKDNNYKITFTEELNRKFNLEGKHSISPQEWEGELDLPPTAKTEIFNHHLKK